ncbi:tryptophan 7-halogenase [Rhodoferax sp. AJA081-3]|uniref:tryptophan halogenase family protein n=1 Tax=Rhodoferax sp. AJA081-3 TaxID=2752316 RepID=UPI001AE06911|nr:tryptophan halogenase family protein [Rhodoferax sp. AJA081-3]QTN26949.1 tryptophan 7-halogenase [Rhodoferax sp. AJA081-3]
MTINHIAIIGGGTAGWLAANHLGFELRLDPSVKITVIESPDIPTIGVGEGTVPAIKKSLRKFGISEAELIVSCDATFKLGIKFENWLDASVHGHGHCYYHPFTAPYPGGFDVTPYYLENRDNLQFSELTEAFPVAEAMRSPKRVSSEPYQGEVEYAYHVNAQKFAVLLAKNAQEKFGVHHRSATVVGATRSADGSIESLLIEGGERLPFDFYVDCSGFSGSLVGKVLETKFVDKSHQILTDRALVQQVATSEGDEVPPYTLATAHAAGWIWDIPVFNRRGTGFVYSSAHVTDDQAAAQFQEYLGIHDSQFSPRKIPMKIGYRKDFWSHNCIALGLSHGFVEPLEATSILLTDFSADLFSQNFPRYKSEMPRLREHCNRIVECAWERIIDFVQMHYLISDRSDSDFWKANQTSPHVSDHLSSLLERWRVLPPKNSDLLYRFELFDISNYLHVLYGMRYDTRNAPMSDYIRSESQAAVEQVKKKAAFLATHLPGHREWLVGLRQAVL